MTQLTESEIFNCLAENFRLAAEHCDLLAALPMRGPTYQKLVEELRLIEGAARQAAYWRDDAGGCAAPLGFAGTHGFEALRSDMGDPGWLEIAHMMGECHQRAGNWLRGHYPRPLFLKLGQVLRECHRKAELRRTSATGRLGALLPPVRPGPHRDTRPVQVMTPGGLLLPSGFRNQRRVA